MEHPVELSSILTTLEPMVESGDIDKIVITTNGTRLMNFRRLWWKFQHLPIFVNISRHRLSDRDNQQIFNGGPYVNMESPIKVAGIDELVKYFSTSKHPRTSISRVLRRTPAGADLAAGAMRFIEEMGRILHPDSIALRIEHGSMERHPFEDFFLCKVKYPMDVIESSCPVCCSRSYVPSNSVPVNDRLIDCPVVFKYSCTKSLEEAGGVYELIYHPNGTVSPMWDGSSPMRRKDILELATCKKKLRDLRKRVRDAEKEYRKAVKELEEEEQKHNPPDTWPNNKKPRRGGGGCFGGGGC